MLGLDFSKAFLCGDMGRTTYIDWPDEDSRKKSRDYVGLLHESMYCLRDGRQIWQHVVHKVLTILRFASLATAQCVYFNMDVGMMIVARVDDFLRLGSRQAKQDLSGYSRNEHKCSGVSK